MKNEFCLFEEKPKIADKTSRDIPLSALISVTIMLNVVVHPDILTDSQTDPQTGLANLNGV